MRNEKEQNVESGYCFSCRGRNDLRYVRSAERQRGREENSESRHGMRIRPYNWTQPDDSNGAVPISGSSDYANGYDVMMAKHNTEELGYDLEIVKLDWDSLVPAVQSGQVDCVIAGQSITSERSQMVDFTDPYYYASIITLVKADGDYADAASVEDLKGVVCTSQPNTVWYDTCLPRSRTRRSFRPRRALRLCWLPWSPANATLS